MLLLLEVLVSRNDTPHVCECLVHRFVLWLFAQISKLLIVVKLAFDRSEERKVFNSHKLSEPVLDEVKTKGVKS